MNNDILTLDLTRALPPTLKADETMYALAKTIEAELKETIQLSRQNIIYARIDELPEALLDILAYDMHIDWYDSRYNVEAKRRIIKDSVKVHKRLGTKYAVEKALSDVFPQNSRVEEWFEYGGEPYRFRVIIDITDEEVTAEKQAITFANIFFYKNLRSHLDGLRYRTEQEARLRTGAHSGLGVSVSVLPYFVRERDAAGAVRAGIFTQVTRRISITAAI
jgi:phage tail P2-like protein